MNINRFAAIVLIAVGALLTALLSVSGLAQGLTREEVAALEECRSRVTETKSAEEASDWASVERLATREIRACNASKLPTYMRTNSYFRLANALYYLDRYREALQTADECIALYYRVPACHYQRYISLLMLGAVDDASKEAQVARSVSTQILREQPEPDSVPIYQSWLEQQKVTARNVLKALEGRP